VDLILTSTPISTVVFNLLPTTVPVYIRIYPTLTCGQQSAFNDVHKNQQQLKAPQRHSISRRQWAVGWKTGKGERGKGGQRTVKYGQVIAVRMSWRYKEVQRRYKREECASKYVCLYKKKLWIGQRREVNKRNEVVGSSGFLLIAQLRMRLQDYRLLKGSNAINK